MVKHTSVKFSTASVAKGSVVLSKAVEKNFVLKNEISRLRHHVSVLSKSLHLVTLERNNLQLALDDLSSCPAVLDTGLPSGDVVVEEVGLLDTNEEVADDRMEVGPTCEEAADGRGVVSPAGVAAVVVDVTQPQVAERGMEVADGHNRYRLDLVPFEQEGSTQTPPTSSKKIEEGDVTLLGSSGDEDAVIGGVIVVGGASRKARNKKRKSKRKLKGLEPVVLATTADGEFKLIKEWVAKMSESYSSDALDRLKGKICNLNVESIDSGGLETFCLCANVILDAMETDEVG